MVLAGVTLDNCQGLLWDPLKLGKGFPIIAQQTVKVTDLVKQSALLLSFCEIGKMTFDLRREKTVKCRCMDSGHLKSLTLYKNVAVLVSVVVVVVVVCLFVCLNYLVTLKINCHVIMNSYNNYHIMN